jgi:hypothetical protein
MKITEAGFESVKKLLSAFLHYKNKPHFEVISFSQFYDFKDNVYWVKIYYKDAERGSKPKTFEALEIEILSFIFNQQLNKRKQ